MARNMTQDKDMDNDKEKDKDKDMDNDKAQDKNKDMYNGKEQDKNKDMDNGKEKEKRIRRKWTKTWIKFKMNIRNQFYLVMMMSWIMLSTPILWF